MIYNHATAEGVRGGCIASRLVGYYLRVSGYQQKAGQVQDSA